MFSGVAAWEVGHRSVQSENLDFDNDHFQPVPSAARFFQEFAFGSMQGFFPPPNLQAAAASWSAEPCGSPNLDRTTGPGRSTFGR